MVDKEKLRLGVLTSGGDAPGMNAAVRAVVRTSLAMNIEPYAIFEGYQGLLEGKIRLMNWDSVGGILQQGGTVIGSARSKGFMTREGRLQAARHLVLQGINNLVVIGGDGSLTGANIFRQEWPGLLHDLVEKSDIDKDLADGYPQLTIMGLVGSIDNDMAGTDMTIGADTALHRITDAIDAISSTAASHQRTFVVEVMGRGCGYLAMMGALATGADFVFIPESPPNVENWEDFMCQRLKAGRESGRRDSIVVVAEGAIDRKGKPISSTYVQKVLGDRLGEDTRVTILGHVQRGGSPSAFDRTLATILGYTAVCLIASGDKAGEARLVGIRGNRVTNLPLMKCVEDTHEVANAIKQGDFQKAMKLRGSSYEDSYRILRTIVRALPREPKEGQKRLRFGIMHAGAPAPGMNTAARTAVRIATDMGHHVFGVRNGFAGLVQDEIFEMNWHSVNGWVNRGGAELGTNRKIPEGSDFYAIAKNIEDYQLDGLLIIGGWSAYEGAYLLRTQKHIFPAFNIPMVVIPASIDNNLPGTELAIGADTALNNILGAVDKIKQSAVASKRCFVVEVMGYHCGYLALMSGLATGAERVYLPEEGVTLNDLQVDLNNLVKGFQQGKRLGLLIRSEKANPFYTTEFMSALFEEEGKDLFDVREAILGHLQQGGDPSPFDRVQASRMSTWGVRYLVEQCDGREPDAAYVGMVAGKVIYTPVEDFKRMSHSTFQRPKDQWWMELRPIMRLLAQPDSDFGPG